MKVKIVRLSKKDAFYWNKKEILGLTGEITSTVDRENGWKGIVFIPDNNPFDFTPIYFAYVKLEKVESQ
jgi:hypothetical protein